MTVEFDSVTSLCTRLNNRYPHVWR